MNLKLIRKIMKEITLEQEAQLLLNNEIKVTDHRSQFVGQIGFVTDIMADGRTLEVMLPNREKADDRVFLDVTFVSEVQERTQFAKTSQSLGPDANSVLPKNRL
jgi:hypothetical protein